MDNRKLHRGLVLAALAGLGGVAEGQNVHWSNQGASLTAGIAPSVFLTDANVAEVDRFLSGQPVKIVKIPSDVSPATISTIYNKYKIDFTFADLEGSDALARTTSLVNQIKASAATGSYVKTNQAYVSNFAFAPLYGDRTAPGPTWTMADYYAAGLNMSSEALYPGSGGFRNPSTGDSSAPAVRAALFTLPIARLSFASIAMPAGHAHVPYVNRFNNWMNAALDTDKDPSNGFRFETTDQLPSRGDFQAQVFHYRLRGATGVHGLDGGVEGYTAAQFESDIEAGWNGPSIFANIMSDPGARKATLDTMIKSDGASKTIEQAGVVYSGVYSNAQGKLALLLSNLDEQPHTINFPAIIGGKSVTGDYRIAPGTHQVLTFGAAGSIWDFQAATSVFIDDNRAGVGVPEPTAVALFGVGMIGLMSRRRARRLR
jgi:hypothetical protein